MRMNRVSLVLALCVCLGALAGVATGQDPAPAKTDSTAAAAKPQSTLPPSTNPTGRVLFPSEGQTEEQQMADQLECYRWASEQMAWDPYAAYDVLVEKGYVAAQTAEQAQGGLVKGAARGAAAGAIIGAIAGDAGKGAAIGAATGGLAGGGKSRRGRMAAQTEMDAAIAEYEKKLVDWDRNYSACMTGKKYTVN